MPGRTTWLTGPSSHIQGDEDTFQSFPSDLRARVAEKLGPDHRVTTAIFPKYETKGELGLSTELFLSW